MEAEDCRTDWREAERPSSGASIVPPVARMLRHLLSPARTAERHAMSRCASDTVSIEARRC